MPSSPHRTRAPPLITDSGSPAKLQQPPSAATSSSSQGPKKTWNQNKNKNQSSNQNQSNQNQNQGNQNQSNQGNQNQGNQKSESSSSKSKAEGTAEPEAAESHSGDDEHSNEFWIPCSERGFKHIQATRMDDSWVYHDGGKCARKEVSWFSWISTVCFEEGE